MIAKTVSETFTAKLAAGMYYSIVDYNYTFKVGLVLKIVQKSAESFKVPNLKMTFIVSIFMLQKLLDHLSFVYTYCNYRWCT